MIELQIRSLISFADALVYSCIKNFQSGKPYFVSKIGWLPRVLDITQMQFLHNIACFSLDLDHSTKLKITLRSSGKRNVDFWCYAYQLNKAALYKKCSTVHLLCDKRSKRLVLNG